MSWLVRMCSGRQATRKESGSILRESGRAATEVISAPFISEPFRRRSSRFGRSCSPKHPTPRTSWCPPRLRVRRLAPSRMFSENLLISALGSVVTPKCSESASSCSHSSVAIPVTMIDLPSIAPDSADRNYRGGLAMGLLERSPVAEACSDHDHHVHPAAEEVVELANQRVVVAAGLGNDRDDPTGMQRPGCPVNHGRGELVHQVRHDDACGVGLTSTQRAGHRVDPITEAVRRLADLLGGLGLDEVRLRRIECPRNRGDIDAHLRSHVLLSGHMPLDDVSHRWLKIPSWLRELLGVKRVG